MSHELRSPLNAILGFAQLMESDTPPPSESARASIEQISQAGWYLLRLINEILDLAVIESGRISLSPEPVALGSVLQQCQAMIQPQAVRRGIKMAFPRFGAPVFVHVDRTRLKQVIINLLSNAIKYNKVGGEVAVACTLTTDAHVLISVTDTGAGLPEEKVAQLFQSFNRLGQQHGTEEGTGIGLMVSKQLTELIGGSIGVTSTVGVGSVFWIQFKECIQPGMAIQELAPPTTSSALEPQSARRHTLLYVEGNPANLMLIQQLIARRSDMQLLSATEATRGIEVARTALPEVILMDINLPGLSGLQALTILREDPLTRHIPDVALSANALPRDVEKGLEAGFFR